MKIFITGGLGFIGSEVIQALESQHEIVSFGHPNQDILDFDSVVKAMNGCEVVIHLAAIRKPLEDKTFADYFKVNDIGTQNVAQAALENKVKRFIYASSMSYYGIERGLAVIPPIQEQSPILTQHAAPEKITEATRDCDIAYSTSKVIAEQILANFGLTKKMEVILLRFGPTRKRGEYRPFGDLQLNLKIENAIQVIKKAVETKGPFWYEAFTILDENKNVDLSKARAKLGYQPI